MVDQLFTNLEAKAGNNNLLNVVYKLKCFNCSKTYTGQTSQNLKPRVISHKSYKRLIEKYLCFSRICDLHKTQNRLRNFSVLCTERNYFETCFLEIVNNDQNSMNRQC